MRLSQDCVANQPLASLSELLVHLRTLCKDRVGPLEFQFPL